MTAFVVEVEKVTKIYRLRGSRRTKSEHEIRAVDNVSFDVPVGRSLAIVGESGSGKTTIARMIVGLELPTSGMIRIAGHPRPVSRASPKERRLLARDVQIVFQDPYASLDPRQTVASCIDEVLKFHFRWESGRRRDRVAELLAQVGLDETFAARLPKEMSGGQRQRVAIARALAAEPRVLVLDEAVSALDVSIQAQVLNLLADIGEQTAISYIFISHNIAVVRQVSDEILVMRGGRVVERGLTDTVLRTPAHEYTKLLLAAIPRPGWSPARRDARLRSVESHP